MTTKFNVKQSITTEGNKELKLFGTAILFNDPAAGIIKTDTYGDLRLQRKDKTSAAGNTVYVVTKVKPTKEDKTITHEVGTFILKPDGTRATLFLHLHDEAFPAWVKTERPAASTTTDAVATA